MPDGAFEIQIPFDENVFKGTGVLTLKRTTNGFPVVMTEGEFAEWSSKIANLSNFYTYTSLGANSDWISDNTGKWVLNYELEANNSQLLSSFDAAGYNSATISVDSSQVIINGNEVLVTPTGDFRTGVEYRLEVPSGAFKDTMGLAYAGSSSVVTFTRGNAVATPIIRVQKELQMEVLILNRQE